MSVLVTPHRFTVEDYHRMAEAGILGEDDRVELIEGQIVEMSPIGRKHLAEVDRLNYRFVRGLGERAIVRVQGSVILSGMSEPQPDLVLLRPRPDFYAGRDAGPADVYLIIEVADSSLAYDRGVKMPLYARTGIPEAWVLDVNGRRILVNRDPTPEGYRDAFVASGTDRLSPRAFPDFVLQVDEILG